MWADIVLFSILMYCFFIHRPTATTGGQSTPAIEDRGSTLSIVDLPSADFLANTSPKHRLITVRPVSIAAVFSMAPSIAAQMALERELVSNIHRTTIQWIAA